MFLSDIFAPSEQTGSTWGGGSAGGTVDPLAVLGRATSATCRRYQELLDQLKARGPRPGRRSTRRR
jgi:hypothetical protein